MTGKRPGIQALDSRHRSLFQKPGKVGAGPVIAAERLVFPYQQGRDLYPIGFHVFSVDAVISDQRISQSHHLSPIGGVGQYLLVSRHPGVKNNFPACFAGA